MSQNVTIYEVAAAAGVSITTVSRVLHDSNTVSEKTKERVRKVIADMNYRPSAIARGLTGMKTNTIGIILPRLVNPHYATIFNGAYEEGRKNGMSVSLFPWKSLYSQDYNPAMMLAERRLDGVIINVEYLTKEDDEMLQNQLAELRRYMPVVLIGAVPDHFDYPSIFYNHAQSMKEVVSYLASLGHERIAFIGGTEGDQDPYRRDVGYLEGLKEARLPYFGSYRAYCESTPEAGAQCLTEMLDTLQPKFWPTAVVGINDLVALGCKVVCDRRGMKIGTDMSIVGYDNLFFDEYSRPRMTSVDTKPALLGSEAVKLLLSEETGRHQAETLLIKRDSCGKPRE